VFWLVFSLIKEDAGCSITIEDCDCSPVIEDDGRDFFDFRILRRLRFGFVVMTFSFSRYSIDFLSTVTSSSSSSSSSFCSEIIDDDCSGNILECLRRRFFFLVFVDIKLCSSFSSSELSLTLP
jgi:hypothetical protein